MSLAEDIALAREGINRQPGCPMPNCAACRIRQERVKAFERVVAAARPTPEDTPAIAAAERELVQQIEGIVEQTERLAHMGSTDRAKLNFLVVGYAQIRDLVCQVAESRRAAARGTEEPK